MSNKELIESVINEAPADFSSAVKEELSRRARAYVAELVKEASSLEDEE